MMPADRKVQSLASDTAKVPETAAAEGQGHPKRRNRARDLKKAITLRPKDVFELYGIPDSTLCVMCKDPDKAKRPPSIKIPGRKGHRGIRLFEKDLFEDWYRQYRC